MKEMGGYFELELSSGEEYHPKALRLNTARNALEFLLQRSTFSTIYIPFFTCDAVLEPIQKLNIKFEFYRIDENFEPIFDFSEQSESEAFLYTNYFGIKDNYIDSLSKKAKNLIIDNAQSFYSEPTIGVGTFYSPRKFFGLPDGGYLYMSNNDQISESTLQRDSSVDRFTHLIKRADLSAQAGYQDFVATDASLSHQPVKAMSLITAKLLKSIDYFCVKQRRQANFRYLQKHLEVLNKINLSIDSKQVPMVYPFWGANNKLKNELIQHSIFTATYWPNVLDWTDSSMLEHKFVTEIVYLPIDQRYNEEDLNRIIQIIKENER